ncbi:glycosyltransferase family 39 protein [Neobacillus citreus]|uniref:Glycosyltransferase family 39 protein n=1 Tax=Neobacillus citreus TaxID=2833578 RepID=A0A942T1V7_9BACI|nr:glycosyltransferase family 39 protein [Neobacillus citreus]MCH6266007.1 glycosyltransferase family 39 protein [Neobacillus citreus]
MSFPLLRNINQISPILIIYILLTFIASSITNAPVHSIAFCYILILFFFLNNIKLLRKRNYQIIYTILFAVTNSLLIYQATNKNLPLGGVDWWNFNNQAMALLNESHNLVSFLLNENNLFSKLVAIIYLIFGPNTEQIYFFIFLTSLLVFNYIYKTAYLLLNNNNKASLAALIWSIWPSEIIHSITFLREMPIQLFFIMSLYYFISFINKRNILFFFLAIAFSIFTAMMHSGMIGVVVSYLFIGVSILGNKRSSMFSPVRITIFIAVVMVLVNSPIGEAMTLKFQNIDSIDDVIDKKQRVEGNTAYITSTPQNSMDLLLQTPYRLLMFALAPLPWQVYSFGTLLSWMLDGLLRIVVVWKLFEFFKLFKPNSENEHVYKYLFILIVIFTYLIFSWGTQNYGTAIRHRLKIFPMEIILIFPYLEMVKSRMSFKNKLKGGGA